MFDLDRFVADCRTAVLQDSTHKSVGELIERAVSDPKDVLRGLGEPSWAGLHCLFRSPELTVINMVWGPMMTVRPHNHGIWGIFGIYAGAEDNVYWRRVQTENGPRIEAAGAKALRSGDACAMGADLIHSVTNPIAGFTAALHVYGGDFYREDRSEWEPETLTEQPFDFEKAKRIFEQSNARESCA